MNAIRAPDRGDLPPPRWKPGHCFRVERSPGDDDPAVYRVTRVEIDGQVYVRQQHLYHEDPEVPIESLGGHPRPIEY